MPAHEHVKHGIGQSPEGRRIFSRMTVLENLQMGGYSRKDKAALPDDYKRVFELFPRLLERKSQHGGTLSGGEQQMLAIGRALMTRPTPAAPRRAVDGAGADPGRADLRDHRGHQPPGHDDPAGRAERAAWRSASPNRGYVLQTGRIVRSGDAQGAARGPGGPARPTSAAERRRSARPAPTRGDGPAPATASVLAPGRPARGCHTPSGRTSGAPGCACRRGTSAGSRGCRTGRGGRAGRRARSGRGTRFATNAGQPSPSATIRPCSSRRNLAASSSSLVASVHGSAPGTRSRWTTSRTSRSLARLAGVGRIRRHRHAMVGEVGPGGRPDRPGDRGRPARPRTRACQWPAGPWPVFATHRRSLRLRSETRVTADGPRGPIRLMAGG